MEPVALMVIPPSVVPFIPFTEPMVLPVIVPTSTLPVPFTTAMACMASVVVVAVLVLILILVIILPCTEEAACGVAASATSSLIPSKKPAEPAAIVYGAPPQLGALPPIKLDTMINPFPISPALDVRKGAIQMARLKALE